MPTDDCGPYRTSQARLYVHRRPVVFEINAPARSSATPSTLATGQSMVPVSIRALPRPSTPRNARYYTILSFKNVLEIPHWFCKPVPHRFCKPVPHRFCKPVPHRFCRACKSGAEQYGKTMKTMENAGKTRARRNCGIILGVAGSRPAWFARRNHETSNEQRTMNGTRRFGSSRPARRGLFRFS